MKGGKGFGGKGGWGCGPLRFGRGIIGAVATGAAVVAGASMIGAVTRPQGKKMVVVHQSGEIRANESLVEHLFEMGFVDRELNRAALVSTRNDLNNAVAWLTQRQSSRPATMVQVVQAQATAPAPPPPPPPPTYQETAWEKIFDPSNQRDYWFCRATGVTTWDRPLTAAAS